MLFTNRGTTLCHSSPTWEIDYGGSQQGIKSCIDSFCPNIKMYWMKLDWDRFPSTQGLQDPTPSELKQYSEQISENHVDWLSLWRFRSTGFYLYTDFQSGNIYWEMTEPSLAGYKFETASRLVETYLKVDPLQSGSNLVVTTYLVGWQIANVHPNGRVDLTI